MSFSNFFFKLDSYLQHLCVKPHTHTVHSMSEPPHLMTHPSFVWKLTDRQSVIEKKRSVLM